MAQHTMHPPSAIGVVASISIGASAELEPLSDQQEMKLSDEVHVEVRAEAHAELHTEALDEIPLSPNAVKSNAENGLQSPTSDCEVLVDTAFSLPVPEPILHEHRYDA